MSEGYEKQTIVAISQVPASEQAGAAGPTEPKAETSPTPEEVLAAVKEIEALFARSQANRQD